jgi:glycosyltransferase involved in cell wall biosynthesis
MKIGFAGRWSPLDKKSWSGTYYYTYQELAKHHDVETFLFKWPFHVREWLILKKQYGKLFLRKNVAVEFLTGYARYFSKCLDEAVKDKNLDAIFVPAAPQLIAYSKTKVPIIFLTDATFQQIQGYYHSYRNLATFSLKQGIEMDKRGFQKAIHCILASQWCKNSAVKDYGLNPEQVTVAPLGANLDHIPTRDEIILTKKDNICRLLFLGVEWERKGGQIAYDAFLALQTMGIPVQITIIGCVPPFEVNNKDVTVIPFLDKHDALQSEQLYQHLKNASFLLLPTRAECAGVVFCEASAYAVPSISTDTGGVGTYIANGVNGFMLPIEENGAAYAEKIAAVFNDDAAFEGLRRSSRKRFEEILNWEHWGRQFETILEKITRI